MTRGLAYVSATLPGDAVARLSEAAYVVVGKDGVRDEAFARVAAQIQGLVSLLTDRVDGALLARMPMLTIVANVAVGVDNVDLEACRARGVVVTNTPGVLTEATADLAFGLLLAAARRIAEGDRIVRAGEFRGWTPTTLLGARVHGATLGIVGLGRIGAARRRRARGFGMHVLYAQRRRIAPEMERALGATFVELDALFAESDAVTLHCPLTEETRHLVSAARLATMRPGAVLVNTARGPCVDEAALAAALASGPIGAAGLDVFEDEPRVHPALLAQPNVVLAPHIGSADRPTREAMAATAVDNVIAVLSGRPALTPV
jgi:glyoxylate reductase